MKIDARDELALRGAEIGLSAFFTMAMIWLGRFAHTVVDTRHGGHRRTRLSLGSRHMLARPDMSL